LYPWFVSCIGAENQKERCVWRLNTDYLLGERRMTIQGKKVETLPRISIQTSERVWRDRVHLS